MKRIFVGTILGVLLTCLALLGYVAAKNYAFQDNIHSKVRTSAKKALVNVFPDIEFHSILIEPSDDKVGYAHDELYLVGITYEKDGKIKRMEFNVGTFKGKLIVPPKLQILQLDKNAPIMFNED